MGRNANSREARATNAQPWQPLPGMIKRQCIGCDFFYAAQPWDPDFHCPDCKDWIKAQERKAQAFAASLRTPPR